MVAWTPYVTHRLERVFQDAERFLPDRWDPELGDAQADPRNLVGFGGGPRICLGKAFALMQLRVLLRQILKRHRIELTDVGKRWHTKGLPMHCPEGAELRFIRRAS